MALIPLVDDDDTLIDTNATTRAFTKTYVHTGGAFLGGPNDLYMLIEYVDHVTHIVRQGDVYMLCFLMENDLLWFSDVMKVK